MRTWTETFELSPLPIAAILSNLNAHPEELLALYECMSRPPTTPSCHLPEELMRDADGKPMDATIEWLEEVMMEYLRYAIETLKRGQNGRGLQAMALNIFNLMHNRADQLLKGADPHFPLPQFAKSIVDNDSGFPPGTHHATATDETPQPGQLVDGAGAM